MIAAGETAKKSPSTIRLRGSSKTNIMATAMRQFI
jgi:hypothetical protein